MANSKGACTNCKKRFPREQLKQVPAGKFCSTNCLYSYANDKRNKSRLVSVGRKEVNKAFAAKKEKLKTVSTHKKELQVIFNKWVRLTNKGMPCISCQRHHEGQMHAGHYRSIGSCPELRFEPLNCWPQCAPCNNHLSGNLINYRTNLVKLIGPEKVEWLESKHQPKRYSIEQIKELKAHYRKEIRDLEKELAA